MNNDWENLSWDIDGVVSQAQVTPNSSNLIQSFDSHDNLWEQSFVIGGSDMINITSDSTVTFSLDLSPQVNIFSANYPANPFVEASLQYESKPATVNTVSFQGLGDLDGSAFYSTAEGISADGSTVVGLGRSDNGFEAFRWTRDGGMEGLGDLPGGSFSSRASAVSADGSTVVGWGRSDNGRDNSVEAFRWTEEGGMQGLGGLPGGGFYSTATGVSADGSTVIGYSRSTASTGSTPSNSSSHFNSEAFRWTENGGIQSLADLPGGSFYSRANGISADGSTVVGYSKNANGGGAFLWTENEGMRFIKDVLTNEYGLDLTINYVRSLAKLWIMSN